MPATTRLVGIVLVLLGLVSYVGTGRASVTALIPAMVGGVFLLIAIIARRSEAARKHAMHAGVALALVLVLGTLPRVLPAIGAGDVARPAVIAQILMVLILGTYVALGVKSFIDARRARR
ncbi:MAG: hypothetical protein ACT4QD_12805 [Acidobacteriota bacterium]